MPALPFFTFVAPTPSNTQATPTTPLTAGQSLGSFADVNPDTLGTNLESSENALAFWQQLQTANASYPLPVGQELAAFVGPLMPAETVTPTLHGEHILGEHTLTELRPINGLNPQTSMEGMQSAIPAFQHIENLRNAQPQLTQNQSSPNSLALNQASVQVGLPESQGIVKGQTSTTWQAGALKESPVLNSHIQGTPLTEQAQVSQAQLTPKQAGMKFSEAELAALNEGELPDDINLENLNQLESKSLHEKPLTLQGGKTETLASSLTQATMETVTQTDGKLLSGDALQGVMRDGQASNRSMALDTSVQSQVQNSEKLPTPLQKLDVPPSHPQWNEQVAKRVMIMANESMQTARIQLDPPELGALEVKIKVQHDQVSVSFGSNHQVVRDALEAQSPRLRELLEQQGVNLADVDVSEHSNQQSEQQAQEGLAEGGVTEDGEPLLAEETKQTVTLESDSLVDYFA